MLGIGPEQPRPASATVAAIRSFDRRLTRLEDPLAPTDFARNRRQRRRIVVCKLSRTLETPTCRRTRSADGFLTMVVRPNGNRNSLTDEEMEKFVESCPVEMI